MQQSTADAATICYRISPGAIVRWLSAVAIALPIVSFAEFISRTRFGGTLPIATRTFNVNLEANVPTWFQVMNLAFASALLFHAAQGQRALGSRWTRHWYGLSVAMLVLSLDELASFHEKLVDPVRLALGTSGFFYYAWIVPVGLLTGLFALAYVGFLRGLPTPYARLFIVAGAVFVGGAAGMEGLSGFLGDTRSIVDLDAVLASRQLWFMVSAHVEEFLEMVGIILMSRATLRYIVETDRSTSEA